jgi:hypothetical protein
MRRQISVFCLTLLAVIAGCVSDTMNASTEAVYHVNSYRVGCVGVAPMSCLQVKRGDPATGEWQNFYTQINGFDYRPGYRYRLLVRETRLPPEQVPADASSIRYELVEVIDQLPDPRLAIQDIWVVERIDGTDRASYEPASATRLPYIEFNIPRGEYLGNDGCHAIRGDITLISPQELRLGRATNTDAQPCGGGALQSALLDALVRVAYWRRDGLSLTLLDADNNELIALHKTD